ncbi:hypothetical protein K227x_45300 [Rubripirellula lacrimiformis]|uniref:Uncharacterized protein n=1 Tax=Rubripirellula lacrimiformis TaxID=1930273 RepID=A0A517NGB7_9BACT|nr:hypothetical protein [Rubripirellula lacrimiformis]QDT06123.1 hypothetical protein K227x_45300 [Rubripirellula lacrimiformis]
MPITCTARLLVIAAMALGMSCCQASEDKVWKIEEDWEMVILQPDPQSNSPQVSFTTSPSTEVDDVYFQLQMNHSDSAGGGIHVAAVLDDKIVDESQSDIRSALSIDGDHVSWTTVMAVIDDRICFAVKDGYGQDWGNFGGPEYVVRMQRRDILDLSKYRPINSLDSVDINFGANRISSSKMLKVRLYYTSGNVVELLVAETP